MIASTNGKMPVSGMLRKYLAASYIPATIHSKTQVRSFLEVEL